MEATTLSADTSNKIPCNEYEPDVFRMANSPKVSAGGIAATEKHIS